MSGTHNQGKVTPARLLMLSSTDTLHTSHYQITTPFSYHHKYELASALPSPPSTCSHWLELSQLAPPRPWKHPSCVAAPIFLPDLFLSFFILLKVFYTFELDSYIWFIGNRVVFRMVYIYFNLEGVIDGWVFSSLFIFFSFFWCLGFCFFKLRVLFNQRVLRRRRWMTGFTEGLWVGLPATTTHWVTRKKKQWRVKRNWDMIVNSLAQPSSRSQQAQPWGFWVKKKKRH